MAQYINGECSSSATNQTKEQNTILNQEGPKPVPQQIRHIPIFVEGRNEPVLNKFNDQIDPASTFTHSRTAANDIPKSNTIFSRVKDIPIKSFIPNFESPRRSASPARNIPINVDKQHYQHQQQKQHHQHQQHHRHYQQQQDQQQYCHHQNTQTDSPNKNVEKNTQSIPADPITKIHNIQRQLIEIMDKVDKFEGGSRKNKEYIYLDEMLTQNLLKLDTIDTEGKESIKAARREVVNCINKCITVLEAKANSGILESDRI